MSNISDGFSGLSSIPINDLYIKNKNQHKGFAKWLSDLDSKLKTDSKFKENIMNLENGGYIKNAKKSKKSKKKEPVSAEKKEAIKKKNFLGKAEYMKEINCLKCQKKTMNKQPCKFYKGNGNVRVEALCVMCNCNKSTFTSEDYLKNTKSLLEKYNEMSKKK
jgi:hypothetical protein